MGKMVVMDRTGHMEVRWDPAKREEVAPARRTFEEMKAKGYAAYRTTKDGKQGEVIKEFDPKAEAIIMRSQMVGG